MDFERQSKLENGGRFGGRMELSSVDEQSGVSRADPKHILKLGLEFPTKSLLDAHRNGEYAQTRRLFFFALLFLQT